MDATSVQISDSSTFTPFELFADAPAAATVVSIAFWCAEGGSLILDNLTFGGPSEQLGIDFDWEVTELDVKTDRMPKEIFYIPALLLLLAVYLLQMRRKGDEEPEEATA